MCCAIKFIFGATLVSNGYDAAPGGKFGKKDYASGAGIFGLMRDLDLRAYAAVRVKKESRR